MSGDTPFSLDDAYDRAFELLEASDGDFASLPAPVAHFLRVYCAQGVIDNGGYRYFFEEDWDGQPPYGVFLEAYEAIGCREQAADLSRIVETFPSEEPHLDAEMRNRFIQEHSDGSHATVELWGDALCGDEEVWRRLEEFSRRNRESFVAT